MASQVKLLKCDAAMIRCFFKRHDSSYVPIQVTKFWTRHYNSLLYHKVELLSELDLALSQKDWEWKLSQKQGSRVGWKQCTKKTGKKQMSQLCYPEVTRWRNVPAIWKTEAQDTRLMTAAQTFILHTCMS